MRPGDSHPVFIVALLLGASLFAQGTADISVDSLFDAPPIDTVVSSGETGQEVTTFQAQPLTVTGSLTAMAGGIIGYVDKADGSLGFDLTPGASVVPSLTFSARPDETFRIQGTVSFSSLSFAPTVNEMFFDYTLQQRLFFRIGMHTVSWGVTRFFDGGGDLMAGSGTGLDIKASLPLGSGGITAVALVPAALAAPSWRTLSYGLQGDVSLGSSELILSAVYLDSAAAPLRTTGVLKTSLFGIDLFAEGIGSWARASPPTLSGVVSGFYWELADPRLRLYGEYYFNAADASLRDHRSVVVAGMDSFLGSPLTLGLEWVHAYIDHSGILIPGISLDVWPHVSLQIGLPCRYGAPGSFYLVNQPPAVSTISSASEILTWTQRYGLMFRFTLSAGF